MHEETGLTVVGHGPVAAVLHVLTSVDAPDSITFVFEPTTWTGDIRPNDPDGVTKTAAFVPVEEAARLLTDLPWGLSEPIVRRLQGEAPGEVWAYAWPGAGPGEGAGQARRIVTG